MRRAIFPKYKYLNGYKIIKYADTNEVVCEYHFKVKNLKTGKVEKLKVEASYDFGIRPMHPVEFWHLFCGR